MQRTVANRTFQIQRVPTKLAGRWWLCVAFVGMASTCCAAAAPHRSVSAIELDLRAATAAIPNYSVKDWYNPVYRQHMTAEIGPPLQRVVDLDAELDQADPDHVAARRPHECGNLVVLALYGRPAALQTLKDAATSADKSEAVFGKTGLLMVRWWQTPDELTQRDVVDQFRALAASDPQNDVLVPAALTMARYQAQSEELASNLRDIVANNLTGRAADKYRDQPYKLGRPFHVDIDTTTGRSISTTDWAGKVVILDFWATWCPPCRAALPDLAALFRDDHAKGLQVLGISNDSSRQDLLTFMAAHPEMDWPQSFNPGGNNGWNVLSPRMGVHEIPTSFLIDRSGVLRDIEEAYLDKDFVEKLLNEPVRGPAAGAIAVAPKLSTPQPSAAAPPGAPSAAADADEIRANALLSLANQYLSNNMPDRAKEKLNELLSKYPASTAATKAKALLAQPNMQ